MNNINLSSVYLPLRITYGLVPILAGLDKFVNILADWEAYIPSYVANALPIGASSFMMIVGIVEITAGVVVLTKFTRLGAYVVMIWLGLIAVTLASAGFLDIAVRDLVMAVGAYALGQVAGLRGEHIFPRSVSTIGEPSHANVH